MAKELKSVDDIINSFRKEYGPGIAPEKEDIMRSVEVIPTGITSLDYALGIGGIPRGRITEIYGRNGSAKSSLCLSVAANAQRLGGGVVWIDMEHTMTGPYAEQMGVDMDNFHIVYPPDGDQALEMMRAMLMAEGLFLIVVDSVAALVPSAEQERDAGAATMGMQARLMSSMMRKCNPLLRRNNVAVLFTNQTRQNIGGYGNPETTSGGTALGFFSTLRIRNFSSAARKIQNVQGDVIGQSMTSEIIKNKLCAASVFAKVEYPYIFGKGFDQFEDKFNFAQKMGIIGQSGSWYSFGEHRLGQGRTNSADALRKDDTMMEEFNKLVQAIIDEGNPVAVERTDGEGADD